MGHKAPGMHQRKSLRILEMANMFSDESKSHTWIEGQCWPDGPRYPHCGSFNVKVGAPHKSMSHRCRDCPNMPMFSVKTGTVMQSSNLEYSKWAVGIYMFTTSYKCVNRMKLRRVPRNGQRFAWLMLHRLRGAYATNNPLFSGPVEANETYIRGKEENKHAKKSFRAGHCTVGKIAIASVRNPETRQVVTKSLEKTATDTPQGVVIKQAVEGTMLYTDEARACKRTERPDEAHTNRPESFWALIKRGVDDVNCNMSPKHLQRNGEEFAGRHNNGPKDALDQISSLIANTDGKRWHCDGLIAPNGLPRGVWS